MVDNINRLADLIAGSINQAFDSFHVEFKSIAHRSKSRFENKDWHGVQKDAAERLDLYKKVVDEIVVEIRNVIKGNTQNKSLWMKTKERFSEFIVGRNDCQL